MRSKSISTDGYGIDPLRDKVLNSLSTITNYTDHIVKESEAGNPQIIAYDYYGNTEYYYIVLAYNGIGNSLSLYSGQQLMIPDRTEMLALFASEKQKSTRRTRI